VSFKTITKLLVRMETEGTPPRIDRSFLSGLSGGYQSQVIAALRSLDLIDSKGAVQPSLGELVDEGDKRGELVGRIVRRLYPGPVQLGTVNATQGQLEEAFRAYGVAGDTMRKAVAFYLGAAKYGNVPLSRNFKVPAVTASDGRRSPKRRRANAADNGVGNAPAPPPPPASPDSAWLTTFDPAVIAWVRRIPVGQTSWPKVKKDHWFLTFRNIVDAILPDEAEEVDEFDDEEEVDEMSS